ncbi:MAG: RNB domain-containing ribonuclease [Candidatus Mycalebacterium zealandia]|nr:MAG: RNB domain-containing ribonuclease [Candidatus Mycalebacterium zealandia]
MKPGEIVIFRKRKEPCCGIFISSEDGAVTVFSEEGKNMRVSDDKVAFSAGITLDLKTDAEWKMEMRRLRKNLEAAKDGFDLKPLWEHFAGAGETVSFGEILSVYSSGSEPDADEILKLFWAVDKDTVYFKRYKGGYRPLAEKCVEKVLARVKKRAMDKIQGDLSEQWIRSVLSGSEFEPEGFDRQRCVKAVIAYIENAEENPAFKTAHAILSNTGIKDSAEATELLIESGDLPEGSDPVMIAARIKDGFSPEALEESARLISGKTETGSLEDLTALETFSIDDETTEDIDDAISLETSETCLRVGVHISNVALIIRPDGALDREAKQAAETMYFPERRVDIFPSELIKGRLSLIEKTERAALSVFMDFDPCTLEMSDFRFAATKISVKRNMTYDEAEGLIETGGDWKKLAEICAALKHKRIERGALIVNVPELKIRVDADGNIKAGFAQPKGQAHLVVSELMIATNNVSAVFLKQNSVPAIFRSQTEPISPAARDVDEKDPLFPVRIGRFMKPSKINIYPDSHRSLGVECYAQATSPIRRYRDLIVQRQIMSEIRREAGLDEKSILQIISETEQIIHDRRVVQRSRTRFWLFEHFRMMDSQARLEGTVSRIADGRVFAYFPQYCLEFPLHGEKKDVLKEGGQVRAKIRKVDPVRRRLKLTAV